MKDNQTNNTPVLSIVMPARNDNHGGDLLRRMQICVNCIFDLAAKHKLPTELIIVEWNPPQDKPGLGQVLDFSRAGSFCQARIIVVPPQIHSQYKHSARLPLYQMIAKNVGIKRARGEYVLATNVDLLFSDELFAFMASGKMTPDKMYRVDRYDVKTDVPENASVEQQLEWCKNNLIRINYRDGSLNVENNKFHRIYDPPNVTTPRLFTRRTKLHTNGCGDFTLMAKSNWERIKGYPEADMFSFHLDSLLCFMAHHDGAREECLPEECRIYHIEHTSGWTPEIHKDKTLEKRLEKDKIPQLSNREFDDMATKMTLEDKAIVFNTQAWGLEGIELEEILPEPGKNVSPHPTPKPEEPEDNQPAGTYLSIVVTARNDDHGGNMLGRLNLFIANLARQCKTFGLNAELIIVDWNPPQDKPTLAQAITWPAQNELLTIKVVSVPPRIHHSIINSDSIGLYQMIAKNVGIRRSSGKFILATNIDILFSDELAAYFAARLLNENIQYRIDRYDLAVHSVPADLSDEKLDEFLQNNIARVQATGKTLQPEAMSAPATCRRDLFFKLSPKQMRVFESPQAQLHTNACGDFALLSKQRWEEFRGYPELPKWSIYIDGLLVHMAASVGMPQVVFKDPLRIYHIEHDLGWAVDTDTIKKRPSINYKTEYTPWCRKMLRERKPLVFNSDNWGYANEKLDEITIDQATVSALKKSAATKTESPMPQQSTAQASKSTVVLNYSNIKDDQTLKSAICCHNPEIEQDLAQGNIFSAALKVRDWVSENLVLASKELVFEPADAVSALRLFKTRAGGVWSLGAAEFYAMVLNILGIPAAVFSYSSPELAMGHDSTIVCDSTGDKPEFYLIDAYLNYHYTDTASGQPLKIDQLLERIGKKEFDSINIATSPVCRPYVTLPGDETLNGWLFDSKEEMLKNLDKDHLGAWAYNNARPSLEKLLNEGILKDVLEQCKGQMDPNDFMLSLMYSNPCVVGDFNNQTLCQALVEKLSVLQDVKLVQQAKRHNPLEVFEEWIEKLSATENRLYYRDQSPESLYALVKLIKAYTPAHIVELGTLSGMSLRTWLNASGETTKITAIDLSFVHLRKSAGIIPLDLDRIQLIQQNILQVNFSSLWDRGQKVLLYVDAHDIPGSEIMKYLIKHAFSTLPEGSLVAVDDVWFSRQKLTKDNVAGYFADEILDEIDNIQTFTGYYAPYWKGGSFFGFKEVIPLLDWVNANKIELIREPGVKTVVFKVPEGASTEIFNPENFQKDCGQIHHNPVEHVMIADPGSDPKAQAAFRWCSIGAHLYDAKRVKEAMDAFAQAIRQSSSVATGAHYAQAICMLRMAQPAAAERLLTQEMQEPTPHPKAATLLRDVQQRFKHHVHP